MQQDPTVAPSPFALIGWSNIAYAAFVALLISGALLMDMDGRRGANDGGGEMLGFVIWVFVSVPFFLTNLVLAVVALAKGRPATIPAIGCALPVLCVVVLMMAGAII